jgi:hypothetical protein
VRGAAVPPVSSARKGESFSIPVDVVLVPITVVLALLHPQHLLIGLCYRIFFAFLLF